MKQEGHPEDIKSYGKHANTDIAKEILGTLSDGTYYDAHNMDSDDTTGDKLAIKKIKGETEWHKKNNVNGTYECIGTEFVNGRKFEVWADVYGVEPPLIRIDGVIVCRSSELPFIVQKPLQIDKNESCGDGQVFITDFNSVPLIFNIGDMLSALVSDHQKYFENFNLKLYTINLHAPLDIPVFVELTNLGGGGGLPVGTYQYALRYVNKAGDRTSRGPLTPPIPVVANLSPASQYHPYSQTFGGPSNVSQPSSYGIKLKFRVTNINDYDSIEVIRIAYNIGAGPNYTPETRVVGRIAISPQQYSIVEFIDPAAANVSEIITDSEDATQMWFIKRAKAIRYYDSRLSLMNFEVESKDVNLSFNETDEQVMFPVIQNMGTPGHSDPYNFTYYKNYMGGERYGFGIQVFDPAGGKAFVQEIPGFENYLYPNRRGQLSSTSQDYSYFGSVTAANVNSSVTKTFEVFDHEGAISKNDRCSFKNIHKKGDKAEGTASHQTNAFCSIDPEDFGAKVRLGRVRAPYAPYGPTNKNDYNNSHGYVINSEVHTGSDWESYSPQCFGLNYYSHGLALSGVTGFPEWAKSFSVVRTEPAGRVVMQGLGMYSLNPGDFDLIGNKALVTKRGDRLWFFSPDYESNLVSVDTVNDIIANPGNYEIQLVSPLGFFSEVYTFEANTAIQRRSRIVDMITYARVLRDNGQINPTESGVGIGGYVAYNKYRNSHSAGSGAFIFNNGDKLFGISSCKKIIEGRNNLIEIQLNQTLYNEGGTGGAANSDFEDQELKDWHEPFYIVNIIRNGRNIVDKNIKEYLSTGHYQKLESIIGVSNGGASQAFELVDERWEDCIPFLNGSGSFSSRDSFVYIQPNNAPEQRWINVSFRTPAQVSAIINDINLNGFYEPTPGIQVTGIYTHTNSGNRNFTIEFSHVNFIPPSESKIVVKYDSSMPIRFFGGDTTIGECAFAPIDKQANGENTDDERDNQFAFNNGFPFRQWRINPRHYVIRDSGAAVNQIQDETDAHLGYIRQMIMMFTCESRAVINYAYSNGNSPFNTFFPQTHYVIRPNRWSEAQFSSGDTASISIDNKLLSDYLTEYQTEWFYWKLGGFRVTRAYNNDYSKQSPIDHFSKPDIGFEEKLHFCDGVTWSLTRPSNVQDSPGLKTFLTSNTFYTGAGQGEIKKAWSATTGGKGENLYSIHESGVAILLTKKSILSNLNADELSAMSSDNFISGVYWLNKAYGCDDEMWRGIAESDATVLTQDGEVVIETLFIPNKHSVFSLSENRLTDILKDGYYARVKPVLNEIRPGFETKITGAFFHDKNQYWLQITYVDCSCGEEETETFVYSKSKGGWAGTNGFKFDKYIQANRDIYGCRSLQTFKLNEGLNMNGSPVSGHLMQISSITPDKEKEFILINVNSDKKPVEIQFLDENKSIMGRINQSINGQYYLKDYNGWEQFIPRMDQAYNFNRDRIQGRLLMYKIIHNLAEDFKVNSSNVQFKIIK